MEFLKVKIRRMYPINIKMFYDSKFQFFCFLWKISMCNELIRLDQFRLVQFRYTSLWVCSKKVFFLQWRSACLSYIFPQYSPLSYTPIVYPSPVLFIHLILKFQLASFSSSSLFFATVLITSLFHHRFYPTRPIFSNPI